MKKEALLIIILFSFFLGSTAQNFSVKSFKALPNDLTASSLEGKRIDQNGQVAALIKVVTTQTGFTFEGGALGIVDTKQNVSEIWVWVPRGLRKITIKHQQLGQLRDFFFPVEIEAERTYEMVLLTSEIEPDFGWIEVLETDVLRNADVFVDGKYVGKAPIKRLTPSGSHEIKITKEPYDDYTSAIQIQNNEATILSPKLRTNTRDEKVFSVNGVSFIMKKVEGGTFAMGMQTTDPKGPNYYEVMYPEDQALDYSSPVHLVELNSYYMGETEVTQGLWEAVTGKSLLDYADLAQNKTIGMPDTYGYGKDYPMYYVSYNDIVNEFIPKLNKITGKSFRLPTEAEWEYAAWGGNKTHGYLISGGNLDEAAWYSLNSGDDYDMAMNAINGSSHPVGLKGSNELGLYDMTGNVCEWCSDWSAEYTEGFQKNPQGPSTGTVRVIRGGSWQFSGESFDLDVEWCVARRDLNSPDIRWRSNGFRLVCDEK